MARLNEAPVPPESHLEILRRKFLRQNRDIAKINSDQSQKIRRLENDCARLLSENLDLHGQILRLEKQIEDNGARRIADHALEVKAKLEVQLSEFAALLGSLGEEPPSKRRISDDRILAKPRQSMARSPPQRRRRKTVVDLDALAEQEGRLAPIYENKTYPRATMNSDEIMALCAAAEDTSDSPDLGPPPVSRFVEDEPVKHSPARAINTDVFESPGQLTLSSPPKLDYGRRLSRSPDPKMELEDVPVKQASPRKDAVPAKQPALEPASQPIRAGAKRKYGDENGILSSATTRAGKENAIVTEKTFPTRGGQRKRGLQEVAGLGIKEDKGRTRTPLTAKRTPLAAKSTNEDVSSTRKVTKAAPPKEVRKEQARALNDSTIKDEPVAEIVISDPEPPALVVLLESATALPSAMPSSPSTPSRTAQQELPHDTPPPADISSTGEILRPSRRTKAAISYAEPNLRDKMRRPTKELFDAVAGEGKFTHRATKPDDYHSAPTSVNKTRSEPGSSTGSSSKMISLSGPTPKAQQQVLLSPLAQKDAFPDTLPSTVVTERRRRPSAVGGSRESLAALERSDIASREPSPAMQETAQQTTSSKHKSTAAAAAPEKNSHTHPTTSTALEADIYDFTASSPSISKQPDTSSSSSDPKPTTNNTSTTKPRPRPTRKSSMAAAAALRSLLDDEEQNTSPPPPTAAGAAAAPHNKSRSAAAAHGGRKRASMLAPKKSSMSLLDSLAAEAEAVDAADTSGTSIESGEGGGGVVSGREGRIARRRSMML
ncbi:hypothetical protein C8A00DRAFT_40198 [Chaetomidium leptoderma]|uniref:Shugoshin n=1 Tax=Chaetomidium leptoderma TaxID=669021 RepID=A0AAN6VWL8_9PEZI|nr:hypothetical protein C8A00DRAFT_40198 [Chaetomidium leptoderma]